MHTILPLNASSRMNRLRIPRWYMLILTPAKIEQTANVTASAVLALSVVVASALPAAPKPLRALNMPGMQKQMRPRIMVWVSGSGYLFPHHSLKGANLMSPCPSTQ
jgi:hypothetical protein